MTMPTSPSSRPRWLELLLRVDVLSGLMFITVAGIGLAVSWNYPIGTAVRMGTGYVPRLMCWILLALGILVLVIGLRGSEDETQPPPLNWRPLVLIPGSLVVFALGMDGIRFEMGSLRVSIEGLGFVIAGTVMILIAGLADRDSRPLEVVASAAVLVFFTWATFVWALGLTIPVWPGG